MTTRFGFRGRVLDVRARVRLELPTKHSRRRRASAEKCVSVPESKKPSLFIEASTPTIGSIMRAGVGDSAFCSWS